MNLSLYIYGTSFIHKISFQMKLMSLILLSTLLFSFPNLWLAVIFFIVVIGLFKLAKLNFLLIFQQIKPLIAFLAILFFLRLYIEDLEQAMLVVVRLLTLLLFASLITLTTKSSVMIEVIEKHLFFIRYIKINPKKVGLAISLTLRFIPVLAMITQEVKEAQKVRGLEKSIIALAVPVIIRTLKMSDDISDAIESRAFDSDN